jgi:hypothetical protein
MTTLPSATSRSFYFLTKLVAAKNLGEILDFHTAYWCNQFDTLMGKPRSVGAMSTKLPPM